MIFATQNSLSKDDHTLLSILEMISAVCESVKNLSSAKMFLKFPAPTAPLPAGLSDTGSRAIAQTTPRAK